MNIIAAHQHGLIEQLDEEVADLAGLVGDHGQRAVVLHHLYDHSNGAHRWALLEARRALRIAAGLTALERKARRMWRTAVKAEAVDSVARLREAIGEAARQQCAAVYRAYRMTGTKALRDEAERSLPSDLLGALTYCHGARRAANGMTDNECDALYAASVGFVGPTPDLDEAWAAIRKTRLRRVAERLLGEKMLAVDAKLGCRKGWAQLERRLRADPLLPAGFRANPAQHFYALQNMLRARRQKQWGEACDREPDAVALAA